MDMLRELLLKLGCERVIRRYRKYEKITEQEVFEILRVSENAAYWRYYNDRGVRY